VRRASASPLALLLTALLIAATPAGQTTFTLDREASQVVIHVSKTGLFSFAGHIHEVAAPVADGAVVLHPDDLAQSTVRVEFDASALRVTGKGEPAGDVPEVQETMESERVLDAARFPRIAFASDRVHVLGRDGGHVRLQVAGQLTLHGVTRPEAADVTVDVTPDGVRATGTLTIKQTDFGIKPVTAGGGTVRVKDQLEIEFTLVARAPGLRP
jgi:polyisoprenoid-binding protein YceI